jgi:hypothetical protein
VCAIRDRERGPLARAVEWRAAFLRGIEGRSVDGTSEIGSAPAVQSNPFNGPDFTSSSPLGFICDLLGKLKHLVYCMPR